MCSYVHSAMSFVDLINDMPSNGLGRHHLYRTLGFNLVTCPPAPEHRRDILNKVRHAPFDPLGLLSETFFYTFLALQPLSCMHAGVEDDWTAGQHLALLVLCGSVDRISSQIPWPARGATPPCHAPLHCLSHACPTFQTNVLLRDLLGHLKDHGEGAEHHQQLLSIIYKILAHMKDYRSYMVTYADLC